MGKRRRRVPGEHLDGFPVEARAADRGQRGGLPRDGEVQGHEASLSSMCEGTYDSTVRAVFLNGYLPNHVTHPCGYETKKTVFACSAAMKKRREL